MPPTSHFAPTPQKLPYGSPLGVTPVLCVTALTGVPAFVREAYGERVLSRANEAALLDIEAIEDQDELWRKMGDDGLSEAAYRGG
jgi:hypothetical protein